MDADSIHDSCSVTRVAATPLEDADEEEEEPALEHGPHENLLSPATDVASGTAFESRARSIVRGHAINHRRADICHDSSAIYADKGDIGTDEQWHRATDLVNISSAPAKLAKEESYRLFELFISLMGINQHFLDSRAFADSIDVLHQNESACISQTQTIWFTQYLLVMAMGMLIGSPGEDSDNPPGIAYFSEAMRRLPPMHELGSYGIISVEILCLASLYLQWSDPQNKIGSAVRLAIALGCTLPHNEQQGVSSEISHRNRVWWTAYMLDRRLSAALGLPMGVSDLQIRADLPKSSAGFEPPLPLIINVQIARMTGEIMTTLYGQNRMTQSGLTRNIQSMLRSLYNTGCSIPKDLAIDFDNTPLVASRTSASLHLMLFQAVILCLRPIILQCAKEKVELSTDSPPATMKSTAAARLCQSCREAASKSIQIVSALRRDKSIALFGYFDLDATFSAAFILAMMGFIEGPDVHNPPVGLSQAAEVLRYLAQAGNKTARRKLNELRQFCGHVWSPAQLSGEWQWLGTSERNETAYPSMPGSSAGNTDGAVQPDPMHIGVPRASFGFGSFGDFGDFLQDPGDEFGDIYSSYNDPDLLLTGTDEADWAAVGRMFRLRTP
ncbi:hypothetical protein QQS21_003659 [Conoideocrella luteorostrata]|uniref:Xylanolytic transcriptional activator regulatory domain-containing protein n=1 Tax=Conoideocrella luteorostrata TaxID=1105319 RepID=A0AAJ0CTU0_9HYPO|nr:hypothetical protein QQS21_003659 [Conoideocrella luteorostrata]